ncbi:MAG TPA: glycerol-3-phosphate dehydrogenase/oxidase [Myxococcota bacterium]|nr:glycerol-3-phosphate dehydrogenase/oxidase [Myxococcota bacterium]
MSWSLVEREIALAQAEREGLDVLVIGGGIAGAGVLRDAASRGLRALLVERDDFAAGTSSRSSKLIHGGLRYIGEGHLSVTREACRERDLLVRQNPHLVRRLPFLFPAFEGGRYPLWQVRASLWIYEALANFRQSARFRMLRPEQVAAYSRDLRRDGLRGAGLYQDAQVDDVRLVLETIRSARALGGDAANHAELVEFERDGHGALVGARVYDALAHRSYRLRASAIVNAAGAGVERVRGLDGPVLQPELRPAKGVHLVIPRSRVHAKGAVTFPAPDGRALFLVPWNEVALIGTTDTFSEEIDEPAVLIEEVHYLLAAANEAFPQVSLTTNDLRSVFAGVRPLVAAPESETSPSSVSREHRVYQDPSGLISAAGGKLTTYRATAEAIVDLAIRRLPRERRLSVGPSRTAKLPLRNDSFARADLEAHLRTRFGLAPGRAVHLVRTYGAAAEELLAAAPPALHGPIGSSRFTWAEVPWVFRTECPATLCDLLERRMRVVLFAEGQGLRNLDRIARLAGEAAGWDAERSRTEAVAYADSVRRRYQIVPPRASRPCAAA